MRAQLANDGVELRIGPHSARKGWETIRLNYDMHNPWHQRQIEAVLAALRKSRLSAGDEPTTLMEQGRSGFVCGASR
jgi:hypothetical protein